MVADDEVTPSPSTAGPNTPSTILVADDDPDLLALMARRLTKGGYLVVSAANGQQAFDLAIREMPDLAILDVMMPELTGPQVATRLRAEPSTSAIRIILISAGSNLAGGASMTGPVADGYIVKPFGRREPVDKVGNVLAAGPTRSYRELAVVEPPPGSVATSDPPTRIEDRT